MLGVEAGPKHERAGRPHEDGLPDREPRESLQVGMGKMKSMAILEREDDGPRKRRFIDDEESLYGHP